jgi:excinuclease ABC subunit C
MKDTHDKFDHQTFLKTLGHQPGVYQMFDATDTILYVGKARDLKKRVASYFKKHASHTKTQKLCEQIHHIEVTLTQSETEALLLESNLIKKLKPRYNVILRDDKSYPYIYLSEHADFPRLDYYRGPKKNKGRYFGPYPSAIAVHASLNILQKIFQIRQCQDTFFRNRSRPCLQYQIKRCTGPCVGLIDQATYQQNVRHTILFLQGKNEQVIAELTEKMQTASEKLDFESAAILRDQILHLRTVQETQSITQGDRDVDIIVVMKQADICCVELLSMRKGHMFGSKSYFPKQAAEASINEILESFISQHYLQSDSVQDMPSQIYVNVAVSDLQWLAKAFTELSQRKVELLQPKRGIAKRWLEMAENNAKHTLSSRQQNSEIAAEKFIALSRALGLPHIPNRIDCFDVSHALGEATVAACVVFDHAGPRKADYRRFNINNLTPGDDYGAIRQALTRHLQKIKNDLASMPDVLLIDGGRGQIAIAQAVLDELQITGVLVLGVSKGENRKAGLETIWLTDNEPALAVKESQPAFLLLLEIRDEAHRFAITGHRKQRAKKRQQSVLEQIPGIGRVRRRLLLQRFGGLQALKGAGINEIMKVAGINRELATRIYNVLH